MSDIRTLLAEMTARADAASRPTGGATWTIEKHPGGWEIYTGPLSEASSDVTGGIHEQADAQFIAAARSDVPALIAALTAVLEACNQQEIAEWAEAKRQGHPAPTDQADENTLIRTADVRQLMATALGATP